MKIVCLGDSLTAGYQSPTPEYFDIIETPYGRFLEEALQGRATISICGICGERTEDMVLRFSEDVLALTPHFVVILGGTNDLGWNVPPRRIMDNLLTMYESASTAGVQPVAMTVPSIRGCDEAIPVRRELNAMITAYCGTHHVPCIDLFTATAEADTGRLAEPYSNDGLHLTTDGYRVIATLLYEQVFQKI